MAKKTNKADAQKQNEITTKTKLLTKKGYVKEPGWCRHNLYEYSRKDVTANKYRIKEWDFYQVSDGRYLVQMTIANISLGDGAVITVLDMEDNGRVVLMSGIIHVMTADRFHMPENSETPSVIERSAGPEKMKFEFDGKTRHLTASGVALVPLGKRYDIDLNLEVMPDLESITIVTPYKKKEAAGKELKNYFFLTDKVNSMPASGYIHVGRENIEFEKKNAIGVLDWGRVVTPHDIKWYWANGGGYLPDGNMFGFEVTYGFGDPSDATETCLFYNGKAHKLGRVTVSFDPLDPAGHPWYFHEENGRFEMTMTPFFDNYSNLNLGIVSSLTHQCHGRWNGTATLDDGTVLEIKDMYAFCENVHNRW